MATKRQTIEVGVFLTVMFAILAAVLIYLAGLRKVHLDEYHITFTESVVGLTAGSKVTYRGAPVGKITDLVVSRKNLIAVTIGVNPKKVTLREGVRAKYSMETIFGPFTIDLSGPDDQDATARPLDPGETIPVSASLLGSIYQEVPGTLVDVRKVVAKLRDIINAVKPEDVEHITKRIRTVLDNADQGITEIRAEAKGLSQATTKAVQGALAELKKTNESLAPSLKKLEETVQKLNRVLDTMNQTIAENRGPLKSSLKSISEIAQRLNKQLEGIDLPAAVKSVEQTARKVGAAADDVGKASAAIAQGRRELSRSVLNVERSLVRSLDELERALTAARALIETLDRDPSALLRGRRREPEGEKP